MVTTDEYGLYQAGWKNIIVDEAFQHPAKYSRNLIKWIYEHCLSEHWLHEGDTVIDPFGGVALGGLDAMRLGLNWIGIELEPRFVDLGNQNVSLWNARYGGKLPRWGTARLVQGDSRRLLAVVREAGVVVVSSPPYAHDTISRDQRPDNPTFANRYYGESDGQLAALREGDLGAVLADGVEAAISSPPYAESLEHGGTDRAKFLQGGRGGMPNDDGYGTTDGNLAALRATDDGFEAAVSSPPYEGSMETRGGIDPEKSDHIGGPHSQMNNSDTRYGESDGQLCTESGDTFWAAAKTIVSQTFAALKPGGHAAWVVKSFVRNGARVDFPGQWRQLCESIGLETLHEHRAWLVEEHGAQMGLDGNHQTKRKERKSFFRRLAEAKGSPRIDYELVICMQKPE